MPAKEVEDMISQWKWAVQRFLETDVGIGSLRGIAESERTTFRELLEVSIPIPGGSSPALSLALQDYKTETREAIYQRFCFYSLVKNSDLKVETIRQRFTMLVAQARGGRLDIQAFIEKRLAELARRGLGGSNTIPAPADADLLTSISERATVPYAYDPKFLEALRDLESDPGSAIMRFAESHDLPESSDFMRPPPQSPSQPSLPAVKLKK